MIKGETFVDDLMDLSGGDYERCVFNGCILILDKAKMHGKKTRLIDNRFEHCLLQGDGWPEQIWPLPVTPA